MRKSYENIKAIEEVRKSFENIKGSEEVRKSYENMKASEEVRKSYEDLKGSEEMRKSYEKEMLRNLAKARMDKDMNFKLKREKTVTLLLVFATVICVMLYILLE